MTTFRIFVVIFIRFKEKTNSSSFFPSIPDPLLQEIHFSQLKVTRLVARIEKSVITNRQETFPSKSLTNFLYPVTPDSTL